MRLFKPPNSVQRAKWEKVKSQGKRRFVLRVGVLQWGGFMFIVMTAQSLLRKPPFPHPLIVDYVFEIIIGLLIWPIAGYCFGLAMWAFYSSRFSDGAPSNDK
jgi:hypothetical protein